MSDQATLSVPRQWGHSVGLVPVSGVAILVLGGGLIASVARASQVNAGWCSWVVGLGGFLVGVAATTLAFHFRYQHPLARVAGVCAQLGSGDLSQTIPEIGSRHLRALVRVLNTVLADFQEVLLLFAHLLRVAKASVQMLKDRADANDGNAMRSLVVDLVGDLGQMEEIIEGFRYFRVRIERGAITDIGLETKAVLAPIEKPSPRLIPGEWVPAIGETGEEESNHD